MIAPRLFQGSNPLMNKTPKRKEIFGTPWLTKESADQQRQQLAGSNPDYMKQLQAQLGGQKRIHGVWDGALDGINKAISGWKLGQERTRERESAEQKAQREADFRKILFGSPEGTTFKDAISQNPDIAGSENLSKYASLWQILNPKPSERKVIKGADGYNYYQDKGERVLPNVQKEQKASDRKIIKGIDGKQYYADTRERVLPGVEETPEAPEVLSTNDKLKNFKEITEQVTKLPTYDTYTAAQDAYESVVSMAQGGSTPAEVIASLYKFQNTIEPGARVLGSDIETMRGMSGMINKWVNTIEKEFSTTGAVSSNTLNDIMNTMGGLYKTAETRHFRHLDALEKGFLKQGINLTDYYDKPQPLELSNFDYQGNQTLANRVDKGLESAKTGLGGAINDGFKAVGSAVDSTLQGLGQAQADNTSPASFNLSRDGSNLLDFNQVAELDETGVNSYMESITNLLGSMTPEEQQMVFAEGTPAYKKLAEFKTYYEAWQAAAEQEEAEYEKRKKNRHGQ